MPSVYFLFTGPPFLLDTEVIDKSYNNTIWIITETVILRGGRGLNCARTVFDIRDIGQ